MNLTSEQKLCLRFLLSKHLNDDQWFIAKQAKEIIEKLGGKLTINDLIANDLVKKWYNNHASCDNCGNPTKVKELRDLYEIWHLPPITSIRYLCLSCFNQAKKGYIST